MPLSIFRSRLHSYVTPRTVPGVHERIAYRTAVGQPTGTHERSGGVWIFRLAASLRTSTVRAIRELPDPSPHNSSSSTRLPTDVVTTGSDTQRVFESRPEPPGPVVTERIERGVLLNQPTRTTSPFLMTTLRRVIRMPTARLTTAMHTTRTFKVAPTSLGGAASTLKPRMDRPTNDAAVKNDHGDQRVRLSP